MYKLQQFSSFSPLTMSICLSTSFTTSLLQASISPQSYDQKTPWSFYSAFQFTVVLLCCKIVWFTVLSLLCIKNKTDIQDKIIKFKLNTYLIRSFPPMNNPNETMYKHHLESKGKISKKFFPWSYLEILFQVLFADAVSH